MDWLPTGNKFLGIEWHLWKVIGWAGNIAFFTRFFVQWYVSEKRKQVVIPVSFWWLSIVGSLCLLMYAIFYQRDSVFIFAYLFTWIPYVRNLILERRRHQPFRCSNCSRECARVDRYCAACGTPLQPPPTL